jgi:hypothetical protein
MSAGTYMGKPIEDFSKEELIQIIKDMEYRNKRDSEQLLKDLELFIR